LYVICLAFVPIAATRLVFSGMQVKAFGYAPVFGPIWPVWILFSYILTVMAFLNFIRTWRTSIYAEQRNRAAYIMMAIAVSWLAGTLELLPVFGLPLFPTFIIGNIIYCCIITIAIVKHTLLDIRIVLRKSIAYVLMSALIAIPFVGIFLLVTNVFVEGGFPLWAYFVLAIILALVLPQLWQRVQRRVDRWFYRERYDCLKALENFSWQTQSVTDSTKLGSTMVNLIAKALQSSSVYLLQPLAYDGDFAVASSAGVNSLTSAIRLKKGGALVKWLERSNSMLSYEDIEIIPQLQGVTSKEKQTLQQVGAELIVPLKTPTGQLSGVLILGKKLSEQPYTSEDKQLLSTIGSQMITNLENAHLYNDALQARENLEAWLNSMTDSVMIVNMDYSVQFMNKAALEHLGANGGEVCWEALGKDAECPKCPIQRYLRGSKEGYHYASGIADRQYDVAVAPLLNPDGGTSIIEVFRDVSERKQAEEREQELQQELYLSSRLAAVGELAAGVAHQINNPLTGVLGFSQRLLRKSTDQEVSQDLRRIYNEAERAAKVVQNLLTFARRREPKKEYSDVNDIVQSALELRAYELKTSNIEVVTDLAPSLPQIMLDFHQIQEVFLNIILNAEQVMTEAHSGGRLTIKTEERKGYIRTTFTDDGPGIAREHLNKLFDPFFSTRGERGGTGLGLSVCHGIITEHGGRIYAKNKLGKGATFFVELPLAR
ncbi:MAG: ATP-binding protein, partial [Dehalococcoidia bacterium]|nr:ATP-binding protein [Dehalococcoidia bacterium]